MDQPGDLSQLPLKEMEAQLKESERARLAEREALNAQLKESERALKESERARLAEREALYAQLKELKELKEERARLAERKAREESEAGRSDGNVLTTSQWLSQTFLSPTFDIKSTVRSQNDRHRLYTPIFVKSWETFAGEATEYTQDELRHGVERISDWFHQTVSRSTVRNNADARDVMLLVLQYLRTSNSWYVRTSVRYRSDFPVQAESLLDSTRLDPSDVAAMTLSVCLEPDLSVNIEKSNRILPFEMKPVFSFRRAHGEATNVVESYNDCNDVNHFYHRACVHQLTAYMVSSKVGFGVLSSAEFSYFARVNDSGIEISQAIKFNSERPTLLEALYFVIEKSKLGVDSGEHYKLDLKVGSIEDTEDGSPEQKRRKTPKRDHKKGERTSPRGTTSEGFYENFLESTALKLQLAGYGVIDSQQIDMKMPEDFYSQFEDIAASNLQLDAKPYSKGWSGYIGRGVIAHEQVAIKIAPIHSEKAQALVKEVTAYQLLRRHWGRFVPALVKYGTTVNGALFFIAIKFVRGSDMSKRTPSQAEWRAAEEALNAIHSCGLLHGDIHEGNIIVEEGGNVQFIDFGFSKFSTNEGECREEMNQLKRFSKFSTNEGECREEMNQLKRLSQRKRTSQDVCDNSICNGQGAGIC